MIRVVTFSFVLAVALYEIGVGFAVAVPETIWGSVTQSEAVQKSIPVPPLPGVERASQSSQPDTYDSLVFVGDILLARNVEYLMRTKGMSYPFTGLVLDQLGYNPAVIGNFEATIPVEHMPTPIKQIDFSVPEIFVSALRDAGYTHLTLANNHSADFGIQNYKNTVSALQTAQLTTFGHPYNEFDAEAVVSYVDTNSGQTIALIGLHALVAYDVSQFERFVAEATKQSDVQIVIIHWGEEYALQQNNHQRRLAVQLVTAGADIIIGHHPHVVQGVELVDESLIFYSLGNYIFDQYFSPDVQEGLMLTVDTKEGLQVSLLPVTSKNTPSQPRLMDAGAHELFLQKLAKRSSPELRHMIESGFIEVRSPVVATSSKVAMMHNVK